jgi:hypothetical protein
MTTIADVLAAITQGCCNNEAWRGRLCPYHKGYMDGYEAAQIAADRIVSRLASPLPSKEEK